MVVDRQRFNINKLSSHGLAAIPNPYLCSKNIRRISGIVRGLVHCHVFQFLGDWISWLPKAILAENDSAFVSWFFLFIGLVLYGMYSRKFHLLYPLAIKGFDHLVISETAGKIHRLESYQS